MIHICVMYAQIPRLFLGMVRLRSHRSGYLLGRFLLCLHARGVRVLRRETDLTALRGTDDLVLYPHRAPHECPLVFADEVSDDGPHLLVGGNDLQPNRHISAHWFAHRGAKSKSNNHRFTHILAQAITSTVVDA